MKSLKFALAALVLTLALPEVALAHDPQPVIAVSSTLLTITAEGKSTRTPDQALFTAGVISGGKTASEALAANAAAMTKVIATLRKSGIADKDIQTSQISLNPVYGQPVIGPNGQVVQEPRIIGYQASNVVTICSRDIKSFGKVLDALVGSGANQVNGPTFQMSDPRAAMDEARGDAMKQTQARANLYAKAAGLRVVRIVSISEGGGYNPPQPVYAMAKLADASFSPIAAGQVEAQVSVTVQFELAP